MSAEKGALVRILAGKYKGLVMAVVDTDATSVFVADGRHRKLEKTKKLNPKHVELLGVKTSDCVTVRLVDKTLTNKALWEELVTRVRLDRKD